MSIIDGIRQTVDRPFPEGFKAISDFLDKHKTCDKIALMASHFFRMLPMFSLMFLPCSLGARAGLMVAGTLVYYAASENRVCHRRFAILSLLGAGAAWVGRNAVVNFVSGAAFLSIAQLLTNTLWIAPLAGYVFLVIYSSHCEIKKTTCH